MRRVFAATGPLGQVAIKQCRSNEARSRIRFQREISALRQLRHKSLVQVVDADESANPPWYAMEDLGRVSLRQLLRVEVTNDAHDLASMVSIAGKSAGILRSSGAGSLPHNLAITLIIEVGQAMSYAHSRGLIHRDLKPENIMMRSSGEAVVIDPGLVVEMHDDNRLTASGDALGTIAYMAPEQLLGERSMSESIFSLGQILLSCGWNAADHILLGKPVNRMSQAMALAKPLYRIVPARWKVRWRYGSMSAFIADLMPLQWRNGVGKPRPILISGGKSSVQPQARAGYGPAFNRFIAYLRSTMPGRGPVEWRDPVQLGGATFG